MAATGLALTSSSVLSSGRVSVTTLGCRVNAFETECIAQHFRDQGWQVVDGHQSADVVIINSCGVTGEAERQTRQQVRRAVRRNPGARVVVTGCYAQLDPAACLAIAGVDLVVGNDRKLDPATWQGAARGERGVRVGSVREHMALPSTPVAAFRGHARAFVQVQQGCDNACTFCAIHLARGPSRSLAPDVIGRQVRALLSAGHREIVLCGVDLGAYGADLKGPAEGMDLAALVHSLAGLEGDFRLRLSSLDPAHISESLIAAFAGEPRLCPYLHLSLQSGDGLILKRMKRRYQPAQVIDRITRLRRVVPGLVVGADILAGFPTESDNAFAATIALMRRLRITHPHVFAFSPRPGTPAARIPRQVPPDERRRRARWARRTGARLHQRLLRARLGKTGRVLAEDGGHPPAGYRRARSADFLEVFLPAGRVVAGQWVDVRYAGVCRQGLIAVAQAGG